MKEHKEGKTIPFREEMEILSNKTMLEHIKKTKMAKKKKQLLSFESAEDFLHEVREQL